MSGSAREMSADLLQRLGMMDQGNRPGQSGIGQQAVVVKGNMDAVGAAQVITSIGRLEVNLQPSLLGVGQPGRRRQSSRQP